MGYAGDGPAGSDGSMSSARRTSGSRTRRSGYPAERCFPRRSGRRRRAIGGGVAAAREPRGWRAGGAHSRWRPEPPFPQKRRGRAPRPPTFPGYAFAHATRQQEPPRIGETFLLPVVVHDRPWLGDQLATVSRRTAVPNSRAKTRKTRVLSDMESQRRLIPVALASLAARASRRRRSSSAAF